jgi:DNA-binding beta-propeller fold protein YncE
MNNIKSKIWIAFITMVALASCDDKPTGNTDIVLPPPIKGSVLINNEGNFQFGNASLTVLDIGEDKLFQNVFEVKNGRSLGDVFQSIQVFQQKAYLVVNNSQKIEVVNPETFVSIATINGFTSPRYFLPVNANTAYVTEYYANAVKVVDLNSNTIIASIPINGLLEEMVLLNNKVYVSNTRKNYVYIIDASNHSLTDSVKVVYSSNSLQVDAHQHIWVLSNGDESKSIRPSLQRINTTVDTVDKSLTLTMAEKDVTKLRTNKAKTQLYWLSKHVYRHSIDAESISSIPFITAFNQTFYALGVNPVNDEVYVGDARDFVSQSTILRYRADGTQIGLFKAGIITGDFYFYYP